MSDEVRRVGTAAPDKVNDRAGAAAVLVDRGKIWWMANATRPPEGERRRSAP